METIELTFADGTTGRLVQEATGGPIVCQASADGSVRTAEEAGTLYVLQVAGDPEPPQIQGAKDAGYTIEVQYGAAIEVPPVAPLARSRQMPVATPEPEPEPEPEPRRRSH
jgi:hypothetical protein